MDTDRDREEFALDGRPSLRSASPLMAWYAAGIFKTSISLVHLTSDHLEVGLCSCYSISLVTLSISKIAENESWSLSSCNI